MHSPQPDDDHNRYVKTILILAANPAGTSRLQLDKEIREIDEGLRRANKREQFKLEQKWAVRQRDFYRAILDYQPQIVHFSGHGAGVDGIVLENEADEPAFLNADALSSMFELFATKGVECVLLNACYSEVQAKAISQHVNYVIGMNRTIGDSSAIAFSVAFYDALAAGQQMEFAYKLGRSVLMNYLEQQTPVLLKKDPLGTVQPLFDIVPPNPYVGLAAFTEVDAAFFFGRETFVNGLVEAVNQQPLVGVIGPSGSGKSSVVYAGLFPQLRISGNWLIESFRPGDKPFYQLASVLVRLLEPETGETAQLRETVGLAADMEVGRITLPTVISRLNERHSSKRLLLFADQFEELYTLCQNKEVIERFVDALLTAIHLDNFKLVFTLRADFYNFVLAYRPFRDALQQFSPQLLSSMNREECKRAIEQPAQKMVVQLEAQLTERILDDVGNEPGNLPLLEFALTRLWSLQQKRKLIHQAYDQIGGVKKALANHAEEVYKRLDETQRHIVPRIFVQLVRPGEGTEDTRRIATRAEVGDENWGLVSYLAGYPARLVVTGRDEKSKEDTVEVVHEALIREWLTLREWMNANRQFRVWQERLKVAVLEWKNSNHDSGALLRGVPLGVAQEWLYKRDLEMTPSERDFISASVQQQRNNRRRTIGFVTTGFAVVLGFAGYQWYQTQQAQIETLIESSNASFASGQQLNALIAGLKAGKKLQTLRLLSLANADTQRQVVRSMSSAFYAVKEFNRLEGHKGGVHCLSFSPDGQTIATASADNTVKLWKRDGTLLDTMQGHSAAVYGVSFSPDNQMIATASADQTVRLWKLDGTSFKLLRTLTGHKAVVTNVSFSPDGQTLASASWDRSIILWDRDGKLIRRLSGHSQAVVDVSFSPDGQMIASASWDGTSKLWKRDGTVLKTLKDNSNSQISQVRAIRFSPDGQTIATASIALASNDSTLRFWKPDGTPISPPIETQHSKQIDSISFSHDGQTIATASEDNTIKLWKRDGTSTFLLHTLTGHSAAVDSVSFSPDGKTLASASWDGTVKFWKPDGDGTSNHQIRLYSPTFSPDGQTIATVNTNNTVELWKKDMTTLLHILTGHGGPVYGVSFSPDGQMIATASDDKTVKLWKRDGTFFKTLTGHTEAVYGVSFSPDSQLIASASNDGTIKLWKRDGTFLHTLNGHSAAVAIASFSPDGQLIASASNDGTIKLWKRDGTLLNTLTTHNDYVHAVSFSPDNQTLASASLDGTVKLWNRNGRLLQTLNGHNDKVWDVRFSFDGKTLASASNDKTVKLWSKDGTLLSTLTGYNQGAFNVSFSPDGKTLASGGDDRSIMWNLELLDRDILLKRGCNWVRGYLKTNPNVKDDRHLCDDILKRK